MAASRHSSTNFQRIESPAHKLWREEATRFHQNMYKSFCPGENDIGYRVVSSPVNLKEKISVAIFGFHETEEDNEILLNLIKCIEKYSDMGQGQGFKLAVVYVKVLLKNDNIESPVFRVPKLNIEKKEENNDMYFIDISCRVYDSWQDYLKNNKLPEGRMCFPRDGIYRAGDDGKVLVDIVETPMCSDGVLAVMDSSSSLLGKIGATACVASLFITPAPFIVWGGLTLMTGSSIYNLGRNASKMVDMKMHDQDLSFANKEARHLWIDSVFAGASIVVGGKVLRSGYLASRANGFKLSSTEMAAVWRNNASLIITMSLNGVINVIFTRVVDHILLGDPSDVKSFKKLCALALNIFSPEEEIKKVLEDIANISKSIFKITSSVHYYLNLSLEKLKPYVESRAKDLLNIAIIGAKFLFKVSVGVFDKRFTRICDDINGLLSGYLSLLEFALKMEVNCRDIWSWFQEAFENAKQEYRALCNKETVKNIIKINDLNNEENLRKMFSELDDVIKVCEVANTNNAQMKMLIKLVDDFHSELDANCTCNEFFYSVKLVCAFVVKYFKEKKTPYNNDKEFAEKMSGDNFDVNEFNREFGMREDIDVVTSFFTEVIKMLQDKKEILKMVEKYKTTASKNANQSIPSIQREDIKNYLFINPSEVTDVSQRDMWRIFFLNLTGITIDENNVFVENDGKIIIIKPSVQNSTFEFACFIIMEMEPVLKGMLTVFASTKKNN